MRLTKLTGVILFICMTYISKTKAQDIFTEPYTFSIYGNIGLPSPEFKKAVDNSIGGTAVGFGVNGLFNLNGKKKEPSPVSLGVDFSFLTFGRDKIKSTSDSPPYKTTFNLYSINAVSRLILSNRAKGFVPFVDGMLGMKIFNTRTKIDKSLIDYVLGDKEEEIIGTTNRNGLGYAVGLGWYTRKSKGVEGAGNPSFSMRLMYLWGDRIRYIKRGTMQVDPDGNLTFESGYTYTNMILIQFGVTLR